MLYKEQTNPDLQLELPIALCPVSTHSLSHLVRLLLRNGAVEWHIVKEATSKQSTEGLLAALAEDVPAGHVNGRLAVWMAHQCSIHVSIHYLQTHTHINAHKL